MSKAGDMLKVLSLLLSAVLIIACTRKTERVLSGEAIIDNKLYGYGPYYAIGFSFEKGMELRTDESPGPDITVHAISDVAGIVSGAYLDTSSLTDSFALTGEFDSSDEAESFYNNLSETGNPDYLSFANNIKKNQVWIYKTREDNYVKIRIISLLLEDYETGPFSQLTFQWRIQPDGSTTFSE